MWTCGRWLNVRTQLMCAVVSGLVALGVVLKGRVIGSTLAGLVLMYSIEFSDYITYLSRMHAECQMSMNSVERILEYCDIEQERYLPLGTELRAPSSTMAAASLPHTTKQTQQRHLDSIPLTSGLASEADDDDQNHLDSTPLTSGLAGEADDDDGGDEPGHISLVSKRSLLQSSAGTRWPTDGSIEFRQIIMSYRPTSPPVLK